MRNIFESQSAVRCLFLLGDYASIVPPDEVTELAHNRVRAVPSVRLWPPREGRRRLARAHPAPPRRRGPRLRTPSCWSWFAVCAASSNTATSECVHMDEIFRIDSMPSSPRREPLVSSEHGPGLDRDAGSSSATICAAAGLGRQRRRRIRRFRRSSARACPLVPAWTRGASQSQATKGVSRPETATSWSDPSRAPTPAASRAP